MNSDTNKSNIDRTSRSKSMEYFGNIIKVTFTNGTLISAVLILFFSAILTPLTSEITKNIDSWMSGISYSIPPDSFLRSEDKIKLEINNADAIEWRWDETGVVKKAQGSVAYIEYPGGKGECSLYFHGVKEGKNKEMHVVHYKILPDTLPEFQLSPQKDEYKAGETITIKATSRYGINHIGWAWNSDKTTPAYNSQVSITVPTTSGIHYLYYYAKDNSAAHNPTGWQTQVIKVSAEDDYLFEKNIKIESNNNILPK